MAAYKDEYNQAVFGHRARVLSKIKERGVNLAVWHDPLSAKSKAYLDSLDLKAMSKDAYEVQEKYCHRLADIRFPAYKARQSIEELLALFPDQKGKAAFKKDLLRLCDAFKKAAGKRITDAHLLVFKPVKGEGGFWHTDVGERLGIITLKGDIGTLWQANESLPEDFNRYYDEWINPKKDDLSLRINPRDFAIFTGNCLSDPLAHATPPKYMYDDYRLVLILACH